MDLAQLVDLGEFAGGIALLVTLVCLAMLVPHARGRRSSIVRRAVVASLGIAMFASCIIIPTQIIPDELPFGEEALAFIQPSVTTRDEVKRWAYQRAIYRQVRGAEGRIEVYAETRTEAAFDVGMGIPFGCVVVEELPLQTSHYLVVRYDEHDRVAQFDVIHDQDSLILFAESAADRRAKEFEVPADAGHCAIFVYLTSGGPVHVAGYGDLDTRGYFRRTHEATSLRINAMASTYDERVTSHLMLDCRPGALHFVEIAYDAKFLGEDSLTIGLTSEEEGRAAIREGRRLLH